MYKRYVTACTRPNSHMHPPTHTYRGLLLPKIVVDDFGGTRSDPGMLGGGIYFAGSSSLSCKYSKPGKNGQGTRLMLVNQVALGNCKVYSCFQVNA